MLLFFPEIVVFFWGYVPVQAGIVLAPLWQDCCLRWRLKHVCSLLLQAYVQFRDAGGAAAAKEKIHGRMFAGSMVQANFLTSAGYGAVTNAG